ncbi:hypothetical protein [Dokdonella soli]|uniref:Uncharacterized protein n=1 Tax=Dokdonella soli TaxID=529810 RepID=A0ABN1IKY3_9GAMM
MPRASRTATSALHGARIALAGGLLLTGGAANAAVGATAVAGGSLIVNGTLANTTVNVSNNGTLGGNGTIGGDVILAPSGTVAPGAVGAVGELDGNAFTWQAGGAIAFQLGTNNAASDHLVFAGSLARQGTGTFQFKFTDGVAPPTPGTTYTLITFANQSGFSPTDFSYAYNGALSALNGQFHLSATALTFSVISTPVELQSFEVN